MALRRPTAGLPQVSSDALDARVWPAAVLGGRGTSGRTRRTFSLRTPLGPGRLADRPQGLAAAGMGVHLRGLGGVQAGPCIGGMDWRGMVAIHLTPAASAWPTGAPGLSAAPSIGPGQTAAARRVAAAPRPQDRRPAGPRRQASTGTVAPAPAERIAARRVASARTRAGLELRARVLGSRTSLLVLCV
jgi:hypothetical protein